MPDHLLSNWEKVSDALGRRSRVALLLDFDGTLAPIVAKPDEAKMDKGVRALLRKLVGSAGVSVAIISGRPLKELKKLVGLKGVAMAGNHGLTIEAGGQRFIHPQAVAKRGLIKGMVEALRKATQEIEGALVEDKELSVSLHFRLVKKTDLPLLKKRVKEITVSGAETKRIRVRRGKKVLEFLPSVKWDKGKAALWLLKRTEGASWRGKLLPIYLGDDVTDEDGFAAINPWGISVRVGRGAQTCAQYYLKGIAEVRSLLALLPDETGAPRIRLRP